MPKPTYNVYVTQEVPTDENGGKNTYWTKVGAAFAHNFGLVGAAAKAATETEPAVAGGPAAAGKIAVIVCIVVLFVIAGTNLRRQKTAK